MRAALDDAPVAQDDDLVGVADGGDAVRDQDGGALLHELLQAGWRMCSSVSVSTAERESSRIRMRGLRSTARASAVRCFWPPERVMPRSPTMV